MKPSIVFSHGIWADGSCFSKLIPTLQAEGHDVIAAQYGLDTLKADVDATIAAIEHNITVLEEQLAATLPAVRLRRPDASYLAWLDLSALAWGDDPAQFALSRAKVALSNGPSFGRQGIGHARMNLACAPDTIIEAVTRLARVIG